VSRPVYDRIGTGYARTRRPDPRLAAALWEALGDARTVVNVGAGAGSYEPPCTVLAVEPSSAMVAQRPADAAPVVRAVAEALPLRDGGVDAALAVLTLHHWDDWPAGVAELRRVAGRVVVLTWDQRVSGHFWLLDYFPELRDLDAGRAVDVDALVAGLGGATVVPWAVPHDCHDGFLAAHWRRPARYLDPAVRAGMSLFRQGDPAIVERGLARLRADLEDGSWAARHGDLLERDTLDTGYRIVATAP
jgi:SAM-dependent methyltransferase